MTIEQHIEELRAELKNACDTAERHQLEMELLQAQADLDGECNEEPPY
jgi:hypothetical protein